MVKKGFSEYNNQMGRPGVSTRCECGAIFRSFSLWRQHIRDMMPRQVVGKTVKELKKDERLEGVKEEFLKKHLPHPMGTVVGVNAPSKEKVGERWLYGCKYGEGEVWAGSQQEAEEKVRKKAERNQMGEVIWMRKSGVRK